MQDRTPSTPVVPDFTPVPRRHRHDGWTADRQRGFIDALADTGSVTHAAARINMSPEGAYYLRRQPGAESFRAAWEAALDHGVQRLTDLAIDRARDGVPVPIMYKGEQVGERRRYNDRLLMWILRHHVPSRYGERGRGDDIPPHVRQRLHDEWAREAAERQRVESEGAVEALIAELDAMHARTFGPDCACCHPAKD